MTSASTDIIKADPSKRFFIDMLTRDIGLVQCVLDLVDNSVHGLVRTTGLDVMEVLLGKPPRRVDAEVKIEFDAGRFVIRDTCGGIGVEDAANHVFRMGAYEVTKEKNALGVYGIGMKRALFKLGREICVQSSTDSENFG